MKETELFKPVKDWLDEQGFEVYAEVPISGRVDVVGKHNKLLVAVELKTQMNFDLLDQALERKKFFHYVYIAIPRRKKSVHRFVSKFLREQGIGLLNVDDTVFNSQPARFNRPPLFHIIDWDYAFKEEFKQNVGGDNGSQVLTPYKVTMVKVRRFLERARKYQEEHHQGEGWITIDEIHDHVESHYRGVNPKASLANALINFEKDWCEKEKFNGKNYFRAIM